jgi:membrane-associated protease RseP (regulator of RpoE activity)
MTNLRDLWRKGGLHTLLFLLTILTTLSAGAFQSGANPFRNPAQLIEGIPFSLTLLLILLMHEMGHYVTARWHGVPATLPYFIPGIPLFIGTFGAVIRMKGPILGKRALFDIGVSGPIVGFVFAVIAIFVGLRHSDVVALDGIVGVQLGEPLLFDLVRQIVIGDIPDTYDIVLHPIAFAGWVGLLITALNLIPVGQLDGGHVAYAMFGERQPKIAALLILPILFYLGALSVLTIAYPWMEALPGAPGWQGWIIWSLLPLLIGIRHPPVLDGYVPLDRTRQSIGWIAVIIFVVSFVPAPFTNL